MSDDKLDLSSLELPDEIKLQIDAMYSEKVGGLLANKNSVLGQLTQVKAENENIKKQFADVDLEEYRNYKAKIAQDETARLIAEGKIEEVLSQRVQAMAQDYESKLSATAQQAELYKSKVLSGYIATASAQAGVDANAIDLVSLLAQQSGVKLDANGNPVIVDADGNIRYSKDGVTPLSLNDWLNDLRVDKPLLWGLPVGGGAVGNQGNQGQKKAEDYSEQEKIEMFKNDRAKYDQLFNS